MPKFKTPIRKEAVKYAEERQIPLDRALEIIRRKRREDTERMKETDG